jgi:lipopolysaccharide export system permease protein
VRTLSRHFLASYLKLFAVILFSSTIAITVIEMMLNFDSVLEHRNGRMGLATYLILRIPSYYFRDLIPIASFAAVFCCIGLPARSHEITAIKSGGISPPRTVIPLLCAAAALSGLTLLFNESVVLQASRAWSGEQHPGGEVTFRQGSFWYRQGNAIYSVQEADREARILHGVSVYALSPRGRLLQVVRAERVEVDDDRHWRFFGATSRTFDPGRPAKPPRIEQLSQWNRDVTAGSDLMMLEASAQTLSLPKLAAHIDAQSRAGRNATRYLALYHTRLSGPLAVLLFALLALPLGLAVGQSRSLAASTVSGVIILAAYYTARTAAEILAGRDFPWAAASPWVILATFTCYGVWQLRRVSR